MNDIPVVILCGGMGMRLKEETEFRPKPMIEIGGRPMLWHIMTCYAAHGFNRFILCLGFRGDVIKDYFVNYHWRSNDTEVTLGASPEIRILNQNTAPNWRITLADTGPLAMTGARVKRIEKYVKTKNFMLTYGDAVSDLNLGALYEHHIDHGKIGTVTGVRPPARFGGIETDGCRVTRFAEKQVHGGWINGGFFVFDRRIFEYLRDDDNCAMELEPLEKLSADGELWVRQHEGFWQCMDTMRDVMYLRSLCDQGEQPWLKSSQAAR
jgi:glucose-1-phosphate cytidylyltransferase